MRHLSLIYATLASWQETPGWEASRQTHPLGEPNPSHPLTSQPFKFPPSPNPPLLESPHGLSSTHLRAHHLIYSWAIYQFSGLTWRLLSSLLRLWELCGGYIWLSCFSSGSQAYLPSQVLTPGEQGKMPRQSTWSGLGKMRVSTAR